MTPTYDTLKILSNALNETTVTLIQRHLEQMDDHEFSKLPTLLFTPDAKKVIETYSSILIVMRKNPKLTVKEEEMYIHHSIYCILPNFFKIVT